MKQIKLEKDTAEVIANGEALLDLVQNRGWGIAKGMLMQHVNDLNSVNTMELQGRSDAEIAQEARERFNVVEIINKWLSNVEGEAEKYKSNAEALIDKRPDDILVDVGKGN